MKDLHLPGAAAASTAGGVVALGSLVAVLVGEARGADEFMASTGAKLAGMAGFLGAALLVVGVVGFAVRYLVVLGPAGRVAVAVLTFATAVTTGSAATLALVVPYVADDLPGLVTDPPGVVPPSFIFSGLVMGVCGLVVAVGLRRAAVVPGWTTVLLIVGSVVTMVPLPSRFFLLAIAIGALTAVGPARPGDGGGIGRAEDLRPQPLTA